MNIAHLSDRYWLFGSIYAIISGTGFFCIVSYADSGKIYQEENSFVKDGYTDTAQAVYA